MPPGARGFLPPLLASGLERPSGHSNCKCCGGDLQELQLETDARVCGIPRCRLGQLQGKKSLQAPPRSAQYLSFCFRSCPALSRALGCSTRLATAASPAVLCFATEMYEAEARAAREAAATACNPSRHPPQTQHRAQRGQDPSSSGLHVPASPHHTLMYLGVLRGSMGSDSGVWGSWQWPVLRNAVALALAAVFVPPTFQRHQDPGIPCISKNGCRQHVKLTYWTQHEMKISIPQPCIS